MSYENNFFVFLSSKVSKIKNKYTENQLYNSCIFNYCLNIVLFYSFIYNIYIKRKL